MVSYSTVDIKLKYRREKLAMIEPLDFLLNLTFM